MKAKAWLRRAVVALILIGVPLAIWVGGLESCTEVSSGELIEETCGAPSLTDAVVIFPALVGFLLLLPDVGEISALGITLRGRVEKVEQSARDAQVRDEAMASMLSVLQQQVSFLATSAAATAAASNQTVFYLSGDRLSQVEQSLPEKAQRFSAEEAGDGTADTPPMQPIREHADDAEYSRLGGDLIRQWEHLREAMSTGAQLGLREGAQELDLVERRKRFRSYFAEELELVRAARNAFAHASPVTADDMRKALDICNQLLRYWREGAD